MLFVDNGMLYLIWFISSRIAELENQLNYFLKINTMSNVQNILRFIWPIKREELSIFFSMTGLMFCILFIQNLVRALKDSIVNTLIGTEIISFLKFWGVMPVSFLVVIAYVKIVNVVDGKKIFYSVLTSFLLFFLFFAFYIFPNHESLHLSDEKITALTSVYPNFKWFILLFAKWGFSLFYVISELWPNIIVGLLFWQFINQVTSVEQSKRFYGLFGLIGQTGLFFSGSFLFHLPQISNALINRYGLTSSLTLTSVQIVLSTVVLLGMCALYFFWLLNNKILDKNTTIVFRGKERNATLLESIKMVAQSRYIRLIVIVMICYGVSINLAETPWKSKAAKTYTQVEDFASFVGDYLSYTGLCTVTLVLINSFVIRKFGWFCAAVITPVIMVSTGLLFFTTSNFPDFNMFLANLFFVSDPVMLVVLIGMIQNIFSKSAKYTFFDVTKEMSYVPLPNELKTKGKAAVEMVGTKMGKSLSSLLQSCVFIIVPSATYESISFYLMIVFAIVCVVWVWAVRELSVEYSKVVDKPV